MAGTATVIYSHGHTNQMGIEWWVYDTGDKTDVLREIHV